MSKTWPGGLIRKTPVTPAGPYQNGAASGIWTLDQAEYWTKQGLWPIAGNTLPVEDVFSTYLYTGTGGAQTITNNIDLSGNGGLVWIKCRSDAMNHFLFDTTRGANAELNSNTTDASATLANSLTSFNSDGFSISSASGIGNNGLPFASWTFRQAPSFFDIVTYTGDGASFRTINHNLNCAGGFMMIKAVNSTSDWPTLHRGNGVTRYEMNLNSTNASFLVGAIDDFTSTSFKVSSFGGTNTNGTTYVAYLFAHDPSSSGFIQCGTYTGNGSTTGPSINLGWEPQWLLIRGTGSNRNWMMMDNMRGMPVGASVAFRANANLGEGSLGASDRVAPTATGFYPISADADINGNGLTYAYVAIRRGPMKQPTTGTSVFAPVYQDSSLNVTTNFPVDLSLNRTVAGGYDTFVMPRLTRQSTTGYTYYSYTSTNSTATESSGTGFGLYYDQMKGLNQISGQAWPGGGSSIYWNFRRAPGFFDVVRYTGNGSTQTVYHSLKEVPELMIVKRLDAGQDWRVLYNFTESSGSNWMALNGTSAESTPPYDPAWFLTAKPTSTYLPTAVSLNASGAPWIVYLFASVAGVSKVGNYTGNGSSQTINCGFSSGARFFLVKRRDSTGNWWVWDSARGIVASADPALAWNSTNGQTSADAVDPDNTGIIVNQEATCNINVNGATYIYLAIA